MTHGKNNHRRGTDRRPQNYTNAFLDLNGVPYLLGEYLDRTTFRMIDRSMVRTEVFVDQSEAMRAVVDISIDDIGRTQNGAMKLVGNATKHNNLIKMIRRHAQQLMQRLDVIQSGLVVRVNFQLENQRTHKLIRTTSEDLRIRDRNYFIDINQRDIDDNGLIVNFSDSIVSTVNNFTHGTDRMLLRITSVQLLYEALRRDNMKPSPKMKPHHFDPNEFIPDVDFNAYQHHQNLNNKQFITNHPGGFCDCGENYFDDILPPSWSLFNRFYHFDNITRDIVLHQDEIYDRSNRKVLIPCGTLHVGRAFVINPGHRIIFKLNVWKNDVTSVADTSRVAKALDVQFFGDFRPRPHPGHDPLQRIVLQQGKLLKELARELRELKGQPSDESDDDNDDQLSLDDPCDICGEEPCICPGTTICDSCLQDPCVCSSDGVCDVCNESPCICP